MVKAALLLCLLAFCAVAATSGTPLHCWEKPSFCKERDCPRFETVDKADGYETRKYEEAVWAWVEFEDVRDPQEATMMGVAELFNYFAGNNSESKQIEMGTPLARNFSVYEGKSSSGMSAALGRRRRQHMDMVVKVFLPYSYQDGKEQPPKPNSEHVHFPAWTAHKDDKDFLEDWFVCSIYDPPTELYDRHNEVLLSAEGGHKKQQHKS
ncbi:hypothetical protein ABPG77_000521 [Micractinium sp. CCAP 211/92]